MENNPDAKALYSAVQRGDISGMSFMFTITGDEWEGLDTDHPTRYINSIGQVAEVSAVTFPAYESTEISARDKRAVEDARKSRSKGSEDVELEKLKLKYLLGYKKMKEFLKKLIAKKENESRAIRKRLKLLNLHRKYGNWGNLTGST